ncbi:BON domain-containing protein [Desulfoluna sp.]|uniref:BON domain-containing protein n=1 Tax=Desulfoluna sp. TaxID=2045199 RepID=UPI00260A5AF2|nr:BON domain-containing protein [Desulfoluna sp.]
MTIRLTAVSFFLLFCVGCAPVVLGTSATGVYKSASDERTLGNQVDDATLTAKVKAALFDNRDVPALSIDVDTLEGMVTLTGLVANQGVSKNVETVVQSVSGVRGVKNLLQVGTSTLGQKMNDKVVGIKVKAELLSADEVDALNIDVDVNRGVVTLTGVVASAEMRDEAIRLADSLVGVQRVEDNLRVK